MHCKKQQKNVYSVKEWKGQEADNLNFSVTRKMSKLQIIVTAKHYYFHPES